MDDVGHEDRIVAFWPGLPEHVDRHRVDAIAEAGFGDVFLGQFTNGRQLHDRGAEARVALGERDREAARAAAYVEQPAHALKVAVPGDADRGGHRVAVHEGSDRPRHFRRQLAGFPGLDGPACIVDDLGLQGGDEAPGVRMLAMEAERVAPIERAVVQQVEPRRLGGLVAAQVHLEKSKGSQHRKHALEGVQVEARPLGQLLGGSRAARLEGLEQAHLVGRGHGRHPIGRKPDIPHDPVIPHRILDIPCRHAPLRVSAQAVDHAPPIGRSNKSRARRNLSLAGRGRHSGVADAGGPPGSAHVIGAVAAVGRHDARGCGG